MNQFVTSPKGAPLLTGTEDRGIEIRALPPSSLLHIYMHFMRRWKWVILGCIGAGALIALIVTLLMAPQYTASTTIEISREEARVVNVDSVQPKSSAGDQEFYQTQYGLLVSQSLAERIAKELNLAKDSAFLKASGITPPAGRGAATDRNLQRQMGGYLLAHVTIVPARLSQLVTIRYTSPDPELSARIANMWAQMFIRTNIERRYDATAYARTFLVDRLADLRNKLDTSERALVQYAGAQSIVNVGSANVDGKQTGERPITADNLIAYNTALNEARAARIAAETALRQAERSGASTTSSVNNQAINSLRAQRAEVAANYAKLRAQFENDYPPLRAAAAQLQELDKSIAGEEGRVVGSLRSEFAQATARESALSTQVEGLKGDLLDLRRRSIQYNILQREVDTNRTLYDGLLQRYKEIGIAGGIGTNNVSIIDQANSPGRPSSPRPLINLVLGMLAGLIIGTALSLALDQIDEKITDPAELERVLGVPSLGVVPKDAGNDPMAALSDPRSVLTEAYLTIKTNLQFTTSHGFPTTMLVSSTRAAEGKSTTALALATVLSRQKRSVVLVDADMRSPSVHALIGARNDTGLSNILSGNTRWQDVILHESGFRDVKIIVAGPHPPNSADLLSGPWLQTLITELSAEFDHVIFDAPPMLGLADAALIAPKMEGVVYVVEAGGVPSRAVKLAVNRMLNSGANLMGIVLTKFISNKASYGYGYDYGYGYGSDDGAGKQ